MLMKHYHVATRLFILDCGNYHRQNAVNIAQCKAKVSMIYIY